MSREKTLREKLSEMPAEAGLRLNHLARFLALQNEIEDALDSGWTAKAIWHLLYKEKRFTGKYDCFLKYVNANIKNKQKNCSLDGNNVDEATPIVDQFRPIRKISNHNTGMAKDFKHSNSVTPEEKKRYFGELSETDKNK